MSVWRLSTLFWLMESVLMVILLAQAFCVVRYASMKSPNMKEPLTKASKRSPNPRRSSLAIFCALS